MSIRYVTDDGKEFLNEKDALEHEICIPYIEKVQELLMVHFAEKDKVHYNAHSQLTILELATELVETDLAYQIRNLVDGNFPYRF